MLPLLQAHHDGAPGHAGQQGELDKKKGPIVFTDVGRAGSRGSNQQDNAEVHRQPREKFALGNPGFMLQQEGLVCGRWQFGSGAPRVMGSGMWTSIGTEVVGDVELAVGEIVQGEGGEVERCQALGLGAFSLLGMLV